MSIALPAAIRDETTKCPKAFQCLQTGRCGDPDNCRVETADGKNILFLISTAQIDCPYRICFGYGQVCTCPTHFFRYTQCRGQLG